MIVYIIPEIRLANLSLVVFFARTLVLLFDGYAQFSLLHMELRVQVFPNAYWVVQISLLAEQNNPLLHMLSVKHFAWDLTVPGSIHTPKHKPEVQDVPKRQVEPAAFFAVQVLEAVPQ